MTANDQPDREPVELSPANAHKLLMALEDSPVSAGDATLPDEHGDGDDAQGDQTTP